MFDSKKVTFKVEDFTYENAEETAMMIFNSSDIYESDMDEIIGFVQDEYEKFICLGLVEDENVYIGADCWEITDKVEELIEYFDKTAEAEFDWDSLNDLYGENW